MNIKYTRLISAENTVRLSAINRWIRINLPIQFLKQEIVLVSIVALSFFLFIVSKFFISDIDYDTSIHSNTNVNFGVVVDCGSSGTRAHIFKWFKNETQSALPQVEPMRDSSTGQALSKHITPGLSTLDKEPDKASDYMRPLMQFISDSVPSHRHLDTPIYFMATAGLRLLSDDVQKKILADITRDLRAEFDFPRIKSQVISGEYEGVYSWLSLNLDKIYTNSRVVSSDKSMGTIEMGGASVQVAFELTPEVENSILKELKNNDAITAFRADQVTINLSNNHFVKLSATTFLGLGVNSAREAAIDLLIRDHLSKQGELGKIKPTDNLENYTMKLKDPCYVEKTVNFIWRPIEVLTSVDKSLGFANYGQTFKVRLEGVGDFLECVNLLERVIQTIKSSKLNCPPGRRACSMSLLGENFIPYYHYAFAGLSEMFFTTHEMINSAGQFNESQVLHEAKQICSTNYNSLMDKYYRGSSPTDHDRILSECFKATWLLTVLHRSGLVMPSNYDNFKTIEKLDGREIDWTIGAFVSQIALNDRNS